MTATIRKSDPVTSFINGRPLATGSGLTFANIYPGSGDELGVVEQTSAAAVTDAIKSSQRAQGDWAKLSGVERGRILLKTAALLRERNDTLAAQEVWDTGKPIQEALTVDVHSGADALEYFGGLAAGMKGDHYQLGDDFAYTRREPLGVIAGIGA